MKPADQAYAAVARTVVRTSRMLDRVDSGLTLPQYRLLTLLAAGDERSTALAQHLAVSKPAISNAVEALMSLGHIRRRSDAVDRRANWLQITDSGRSALEQADSAYAQRLAAVAGRMNDPAGFLAAIADFSEALESDLSERRRRRESAPSEKPTAAKEAAPE